jgi:hypothetical protein
VAGGAAERGLLRFIERQLLDLLRELAEAAVRAGIALQHFGLVEQRGLLRQALNDADALEQRPAGARGLRSAEDGAAALAGKTLGVPRRVRQRPNEGQHHQGEACEQQSEKGARVSHSKRNSCTPLDKVQCHVFTTEICRSSTTEL